MDTLNEMIAGHKIGWELEADLENFFAVWIMDDLS
jgi:hypothetical protein